jgi:hypothetical protein
MNGRQPNRPTVRQLCAQPRQWLWQACGHGWLAEINWLLLHGKFAVTDVYLTAIGIATHCGQAAAVKRLMEDRRIASHMANVPPRRALLGRKAKVNAYHAKRKVEELYCKQVADSLPLPYADSTL